MIFTGLAMGGSGTCSIAVTNPPVWSALVSMCGRGDVTAAEKFATARQAIWSSCGDPVRSETVKANAKYVEYPGIPHNYWDNVYGTNHL